MKGNCIMKETPIKPPRTPTFNLVLLPVLIAVLNLIPAGGVTAQTFTTLYSFTPLSAPYYQGGTNPVRYRSGCTPAEGLPRLGPELEKLLKAYDAFKGTPEGPERA